MGPIWQKKRPALTQVGVRHSCYRHNCSSRRWNSRETTSCVGCEDNYAFVIPSSAPPERSIANNLSRPTSNVDSLELTVGEEGNRLVIRRPERVRCAFGMLQKVHACRPD